MTRFERSPWWALSAVLLIGPMSPTAPVVIQVSAQEDGMQYLPLDRAPASRHPRSDAPETRAVGEVTVAQYGAADFLVANRGRFLAVRFDLPYEAPFTIASLSFASRVQIPNPALPFASFRSVRFYGADVAGNLDTSRLFFRQNRYAGSNDGGTNTIPLGLAGMSAGTFYAVFEFPTPTSAVADTFPFLDTDLHDTEAGLFANSYASDTAGATPIPAPPGTMTGTTLLLDQNIHASLRCVLSSTAPLEAPTAAGMNARAVARFDFTTAAPPNVRADGSAAPDPSLDHLELVRRDAGWIAVASARAGSGKVTLRGLGSGVGIYAFRAVDRNGHSSLTSNVVITGSTSAVGSGAPLAPDADEPNGKASRVDATALAVPVFEHPASLWPAGDEDDYGFFARPGDVVTIVAAPTARDFRNELDLVVELLDDSNHVLATGSSPAPGEAARLTVLLAPRGRSPALRMHDVRIVDRSGSMLDPTGSPRVLVPPTYDLSVDVQTPSASRPIGPSEARVSRHPNTDDFSLVNAGSNPARGSATFRFVIPRDSGDQPVKLFVYDVRGRIVTTLVNGMRAAGSHLASWSGRDSRGMRVASGSYFARLDAGSRSRVIRIDLVR